ncbi:MAG: hypothetical protein IJ901_05735 [Bacteroidaceae bacterium]|nr:hypothetical protein [Bacteroidaceae bacterium]
MQKIEALLVCNSNMFVPTVLTEVLTNPDKRYLIISDTANITLFFEFLAISNVIYHEYGTKRRFDFIYEKKKLLNFVKQYEIKRVVFFHAEFGGMANWLIAKLSKNIPIKYCKLYDAIPAKKAPLNFHTIKMQMEQLVYWGQKMDIMVYTKPFPSIPKSFFQKIGAEVIKMPIDLKVITTHLKDKLNEIGIRGKYILLTGTAVHNGWYNEKKYTTFINEIIKTLGEQNIVSKCHPRYKDLYGLEKTIAQIPSFIPGNILLNSFDYFIGLESTLLVEAAQAGKISISYLDWLCPENSRKDLQHLFFENRLQDKGKIYFPKSEEELLDILNHKG